MPRKALDPVDVAFRAWLALTPEQRQRLVDVQRGYQLASGAVMGAAPQPRRRSRNPQVAQPLRDIVNAAGKQEDPKS